MTVVVVQPNTVAVVKVITPGLQGPAGDGNITPEDIGAATAAQGALADSAIQPGGLLTSLSSGAATDGQVPTANGLGGIAWEDPADSGWDGTTALDVTVAGVASTPPVKFSGSWFTGGTAETTKPQFLIEPAGTRSIAWSTAGTGLGINAPSGFTGNLLDLKENGTSKIRFAGGASRGLLLETGIESNGPNNRFQSIGVAWNDGSNIQFIANNAGNIGFQGNGVIKATGDLIFQTGGSTERLRITGAGAFVGLSETLVIAASDETTALTAGTGKVRFRMPFAMNLTEVRASVGTAPTGSTLIADINEGGVSILGDKLSIDADEFTSETALVAATITDAALADDAEITIDIDQVGATIAGAGLKITLIGTRA